MNSFFSFDSESAQSSDGFTPISTGIYDATINTVSTKVASTGTMGLDWSFDLSDGRKAIVYGTWIRKADGTTLIDGNKLNALMGILGVKDLTTYQKTITVRDGSKVVDALKELDGKKIKVALQIEHDTYNGEDRENLKIHTFFSPEGFTFSEMLSKQTETKKMDYLAEHLKDSESKQFKMAKAGGAVAQPAAAASGVSLLG